MRTSLARFLRDVRGGIAVTFAIAAPVLAVLACGAIDLAGVSSNRSDLQGAADAAALNAAHQLDLTDEAGVQARADAFVRGQLLNTGNLSYKVETEVAEDESLVTVAIDANRPSFFANLLPPGGWNLRVEASAKPMARQPLCVLNSSSAMSDSIVMKEQAKMSAPDCMVSSNAGINVGGGAHLSAAAVQSSLDATGPIFPSPMVGAPAIADPFATLQFKPDGLPCQLGDLLSVLGVLQGTFYIPPGVHCGNIAIGKNQKVVLLPGEHYFLKSKLVLKSNAELTGDDVAVVFGSDSAFEFTDKATVRLKGRKTGVFAGFVIATTRQNTKTFTISSDNAKELLGTIYVPSARLVVTGKKNDVAEDSAWTVILAKTLELNGSARLVVNAEYEGSGVPVPKGVGPLTGVAMTK